MRVRRIGIAVGAAICMAVSLAAAVMPGNAAAGTLTTFTWSAPRTVIASVGTPQDISCPTTNFCLVVDAHGAAVEYLDGKWRAPVHVVDDGLAAVSCTDRYFCIAVSRHGRVFRFGGSGWHPSTTVSKGRTVDAELSTSCTTRTFCVVTFGTNAYRYRGDRWTGPSRLLARDRSFTDVSCQGTHFCMAIAYGESDGGDWAWRYNGHHWTRTATLWKPGTGAQLYSLSCSSTTFCMAVGDYFFAWFTGTRWHIRVNYFGPPTFEAVSCRSPDFCVEVGEYGAARVWHDKRWRSTNRMGHGVTTFGVDCPQRTHCVAVDLIGISAVFDGERWGRPRLVDPSRGPLERVVCASATLCFGADEWGNVVAYRNGTWTKPRLVDPFADPHLERRPALTCGSESFCVLVDWRGFAHSFDGSRWHAIARDPFRDESGVSCVPRGWCMSIGVAPSGRHFQYSLFRRGHWTTPVTITSSRVRGAFFETPPSCVTRSFCVTSFNARNYSVWDGTRWSTPRRISTTRRVDVLTLVCTSTSVCLANSYFDALWVYDGTSWSRHPGPPHPLSPFDPMSCTARTFCLTSDEVGDAFAYDGVNWTTVGTGLLAGGTVEQFASNACASRHLCIVSDGTRAVVGTG